MSNREKVREQIKKEIQEAWCEKTHETFGVFLEDSAERILNNIPELMVKAGNQHYPKIVREDLKSIMLQAFQEVHEAGFVKVEP